MKLLSQRLSAIGFGVASQTVEDDELALVWSSRKGVQEADRDSPGEDVGG